MQHRRGGRTGTHDIEHVRLHTFRHVFRDGVHFFRFPGITGALAALGQLGVVRDAQVPVQTGLDDIFPEQFLVNVHDLGFFDSRHSA